MTLSSRAKARCDTSALPPGTFCDPPSASRQKGAVWAHWSIRRTLRGRERAPHRAYSSWLYRVFPSSGESRADERPLGIMPWWCSAPRGLENRKSSSQCPASPSV